jgi:hypothetical protein
VPKVGGDDGASFQQLESFYLLERSAIITA